MTNQPFPILEFDPARDALIEPHRLIRPIAIPTHAVACFFQDVIASLVEEGRATLLATQRSEMGAHPVYRLDAGQGRAVALFHPGVGAPLAAGMLEEVIALGCRRFMVCGGAGALDRALTVGHLVVPTAALRDEGTSYHYLPPSREVAAPAEAVAALESVLRAEGLPYMLGKTWTTDAFYRETPARIARRRAEGCLTVEMEASALFAVAQFRGVTLGQLLYSGDDLSGEVWDGRGWTRKADVRRELLRLAVAACLAL